MVSRCVGVKETGDETRRGAGEEQREESNEAREVGAGSRDLERPGSCI